MSNESWSAQDEKGPLAARSFEYGFSTTPPAMSLPVPRAPARRYGLWAAKLGAAATCAVGLVLLVQASGLVPRYHSVSGRPSSPRDRVPASAPKAPRLVAATNLWSEYQANEKAANARYEGEVLDVTGQVGGMDRDLVGSVVVHLESPNPFSPTRAYLAHSSAPPGKGTEVTLRCQGAGMILGSPVLRDCVLR